MNSTAARAWLIQTLQRVIAAPELHLAVTTALDAGEAPASIIRAVTRIVTEAVSLIVDLHTPAPAEPELVKPAPAPVDPTIAAYRKSLVNPGIKARRAKKEQP